MASKKSYFESSDINFLTSTKTSPLFVVDLEAIRKQIASFQQTFPYVKVYYATKTNPLPAIIDTLLQLGVCFDVATLGEVKLLLDHGADPKNLLHTHPVKSEYEIAQSYGLGLRKFTFDSLSELKRLVELAPKSQYFLRIVPKVNASLYDYKKKFGASAREVTEILDFAVNKKISIAGISFMVGSQSLSVKPWQDVMSYVKSLLDKYYPLLPSLRTVNIGSGFPLPYGFKDTPSLDKISSVIKKSLRQFPKDIKVIAEPGRYIAGPSMILATRVVQHLVRSGQHWLYVDASAYSGLIEIIESGNKFPFVVTADKNGPDVPYMIAGQTMDPDDILGMQTKLSSKLTADDFIYLHDAGAYTTNFFTIYHSLSKPRVIICDSHYSKNVKLGRGTMGIKGLIANKNIPKGELIFSVTGAFTRKRTRTSFQVDDERHVEPNLYGAYLNHSCSPNAGVRTNANGQLDIVSLRDISMGGEVVVDYAMFEKETGPMSNVRCLCGAKDCRKKITGYKGLPRSKRKAYRGYVAAYLVK